MDGIFNDLLQTNKKEFIELTEEILATNLLLIGEVHGVLENAYLYYTLFEVFEFDTIALEYPLSAKESFINYLNTGVFPIHQGTDTMTDGRINKTYYLLLKRLHDEGLLKNIIFFDPEISNYNHWNDRDKAYADLFISQLSKDNRTLIISGNLHAETTEFELNTKNKAESGTLYPFGYHLVQSLGNFPVCKIIYHSGSFYNFEVKEFPKTHVPAHMLRKRQSLPMRYEIHLNNVHPVDSF